MKYLIYFYVCILQGSILAEVAKTYENFKIYKFEGDKSNILLLRKQFENLSETIIFDPALKEAVVSSEHLTTFEEALTNHSLTWTVTVEDVSELISHERATRSTTGEFGWKKFYDLPEIHNYLRSVHKKYPKITKLVVSGHSYEGRELLGLVINTNFLTKKPQAFIEGTAHAREWTSTTSVTYFIHRLLTGHENKIHTLKNYFEWHIFPVVNPDGYTFTRTTDRLWRKNRSPSSTCFGVDLNRNWDHGWDIDYEGDEASENRDPCGYQVYAGKNAFSELETIAQSKYILTLSRLDLYFTIHAAGGYMLIPWADRVNHVGNYNDQITMAELQIILLGINRKSTLIGLSSLDRKIFIFQPTSLDIITIPPNLPLKIVKMCKTAFAYAAKVDNGVFDTTNCATAYDISSPSIGNNIDWVKDSTNASVIFNFEQRASSSGSLFWPASTLSIVGEELVQVIIGTFTEARNLGYFK